MIIVYSSKQIKTNFFFSKNLIERRLPVEDKINTKSAFSSKISHIRYTYTKFRKVSATATKIFGYLLICFKVNLSNKIIIYIYGDFST